MARMKPDTFEYSTTNSGGEGRVYDALRDKLNDEWLVCHSWRWLRHFNNTKTHKIQGEGDFVLFHPNEGIIVIEVKGGAIEYKDDGKYYSNNTLIQNPEKQASDTKFDIIERLKQKGFKDKCYVSHCVWFPDIDWNIDYPPNLSSHILLDQKDLKNPLSKIGNLKPLHIQSISDKVAVKQIEELLHKTFKLVKCLKYRISDSIDEQTRLTQQQIKAIEYLDEQKCIGIRGRAGTGKTILAVQKAINLSKAGEKVLVICYNRGLSDYLNSILSDTNVDVFTYHKYAIQYLEMHYPWRINQNEKINTESYSSEFFNYIGDEFSEVITENLDYYSVCILDEAQDLKTEWFIALKDCFYPTHKFYFFYDPLQIPYLRKVELIESHFNFGAPIIPLHRNMRNTMQVSKAALNIIEADYTKDRDFNAIDGDYPEIILTEDQYELLNQKINILLNVHTIARANITIISMIGANSIQNKEVNGIPILSFRNFKGLENDVILILDISFSHFVDPVYQRELYTAITRSKYLSILFIDNKESLMKKVFCQENNIKDVKAENILSLLKK